LRMQTRGHANRFSLSMRLVFVHEYIIFAHLKE
jgi:hypothetical protein